jgi:RNA polymerase sigma-70 factor (ECF subfamily)
LQENTENTSEIDELVEKAVNGDGESFGKLYDVYLNRVYRHICYRVGSRDDAEDLTQKTFIRAWDAMGRYKKTAVPFAAWLTRIAHNLVIDFYRSRKPDTDIDFDTVTAAPEYDPEHLTEQHFNQAEIRKAIRKLKGDQQQVIVMRFIDDYSYEEIAASLGKSEGAVRVILHRGLAKLKTIIEKTQQ